MQTKREYQSDSDTVSDHGGSDDSYDDEDQSEDEHNKKRVKYQVSEPDAEGVLDDGKTHAYANGFFSTDEAYMMANHDWLRAHYTNALAGVSQSQQSTSLIATLMRGKCYARIQPTPELPQFGAGLMQPFEPLPPAPVQMYRNNPYEETQMMPTLAPESSFFDDSFFWMDQQ